MQNFNFSFPVILDIIVVLFILIFALIGRKRGFVKLISGVLVLVLSFTLAGMLSKWTTPYLSQTFVKPEIINILLPETETVQNPVSDTQELTSKLEKFGLSSKSITDAIDNYKTQAAQSVEKAIDSLSETVAEKITRIITFIVFFILSLLLLTLFAKLLNLAAKLPIIKFFNRTGGFVLGIIWGYLVVLVLVSLMVKFKVLLTPEICEETFVLNFILNKTPLSLLPIWS